MKIQLEVKDLESWYGKVQILQKVNMLVKPGEMVSIIGPNGSGKSTALKCIFGLVAKKKGQIIFNGKDISKMTPIQLVRENISYVPQGRSVFPTLTVKENLELGAFIRSDNISKELNYVFQMFPILKERQGQKAGLLSGGEQQMLAIGRALMLNPELLLLDEPSLGLSPQVKKQIFDKIVEVNKSGVSILVVEQNAKLSLSLSDRAYVLELGRNRYEGKGKELLKDRKIQRLYLGGA